MSVRAPNKTAAQENHAAVILINVTKLIDPNLQVKLDFRSLEICGYSQRISKSSLFCIELFFSYYDCKQVCMENNSIRFVEKTYISQTSVYITFG